MLARSYAPLLEKSYVGREIMGEVRQAEKLYLVDGTAIPGGTIVCSESYLSYCPNDANKPTRIWPL